MRRKRIHQTLYRQRIAGSEPGGLIMKEGTDTLFTRALTEEDAEAVFMLDEKSGFCISQWLEGNTDFADYAWGIF